MHIPASEASSQFTHISVVEQSTKVFENFLLPPLPVPYQSHLDPFCGLVMGEHSNPLQLSINVCSLATGFTLYLSAKDIQVLSYVHK